MHLSHNAAGTLLASHMSPHCRPVSVHSHWEERFKRPTGCYFCCT